MFAKTFIFFALVAVALAAPSPKAAPEPAPSPKASPEPAPQPQLLYTGLDYTYPAVAPYVSPYGAPIAYSAYSAYPGAYFVR